jgi:hypothetical protein
MLNNVAGKGGSPPYTLSWSDGVVSGTNGQMMKP